MSERRIEIKDETGELKFILKFREIHDSRKLYSAGSHINLFLITGAMRCDVEYPNGSYLGMGHSFCHYKDKWDARKGERVALKDALKYRKDKLQREGRKFIWTEYFKQRPIVKQPTERQLRKAKVLASMKKILPGPVQTQVEESMRKGMDQMVKAAQQAHPLTQCPYCSTVKEVVSPFCPNPACPSNLPAKENN
jgi:hypothetical protein